MTTVFSYFIDKHLSMSSEFYTIALSLIPKLGTRAIWNLMGQVSLSDLFAMDHHQLYSIGLTSATVREAIITKATWDDAKRNIELASKASISICCYGSPSYPPMLADCTSAPILFYYRGHVESLLQYPISIVGTRMLTDYGRGIIDRWVPQLQGANLISGLAYGTDISVHRAALKQGIKTSAVLANHLSSIYPAEHVKEVDRIVESGGVVLSETHLTHGIRKEFFAKRNRIIAALSPATIVIESNASGGSMITAKQAFSFQRELYAVPGDIHRQFSTGCNQLIRDQMAMALVDVKQLTHLMPVSNTAKPSEPTLDFLTKEQSKIMSCFKGVLPIHFDLLLELSDFSVSQLSSELTMLELQGVIQSLPGKKYKRI